MTRAVIFDMYETLITHFNTPLYFGAQMAHEAGIPIEKFLPLWRSTEDDRTVGKLALEEVLSMILKENHCYSEALVNKMAEKRTATKVELFKHLHSEIIPMLQALKEKGILIALISNCYFEEATVIRNSELFPYFDGVYLSCEQGVKKPDEEIFRRCMKELLVQPEECVYVGDGGSYELETAKGLGMKAIQAVWYLKEGCGQPTGRMPEFPQAESPLEVLKYLER
ncbi:MAG: HAD family hydrolase [Lachnospiraceae bacterium]|nr:HAD family hydrolase [Lachnospiraceae bacterium]